MRSGGKEMDRVETDSPAHIDFLPNRPESKQRSIDAANMNIVYAAENQLKTFSAVQATTRTYNPPVKGKPQPPAITTSKGLTAHFDEKTGAMTHLEQWDNFRYEEGERRAKSDRADFYAATEEIVLLGKARVWDSTGSTDAERITLRQKTGEMEANGSVSSTRQPDRKKDAKGGMISGTEPVQAKANRMTSSNDNSVIVYEGNALLWQGPNRITADVIRIDRRSSGLTATGNVTTQLLDKSESKKTAAAFTVVRAPSLDYDDRARLAHYRGGVNLKRAGMIVTSRELRAWLKGDSDDSSLDKAFADGNVRVEQTTPSRKRTGEADHAEHYAGEGKTVLTGGTPVFTDSVKGTTRGRRITYFTEGERFEVEGEDQRPVESKMLRRSE
jgi:lipopolysaccharide export system protein LptA